MTGTPVHFWKSLLPSFTSDSRVNFLSFCMVFVIIYIIYVIGATRISKIFIIFIIFFDLMLQFPVLICDPGTWIMP